MNKSSIDQVVKVLKEGGIVIFPTDTVWGIGANIQRLDGIRRLYEIKGREKSKPTAVLVAGIMVANKLGVIDKEANLLIGKFWPGGLTLIVKAKKTVPKEIASETGSVGLRQPDHKQALKLLEKLEVGLVTASANFAGQPPPKEKKHLDRRLIDQADFLLEGKAGGNPPSTVVDLTVKPSKIIRQGEVQI